jgi:hypothetical protein
MTLDLNVEECDATGDAKSGEDGLIKFFFIKKKIETMVNGILLTAIIKQQ